MKKSLFILVLAVAFIACNNKPPQDCDDYPYCIDDYSIHPDNWLCGRLKAEPSPFNEKDTVVAMTIKYVYHSDMNGLTYFITKNKELFSLLDESGNRKESILMCDYKGGYSFQTSFFLYPCKSITDFLIDGKSYIDNLIKAENKRISDLNLKMVEQGIKETDNVNNRFLSFEQLEDELPFNVNDFNINENKINKYAGMFKEFDNYFNQKIKDNELPQELKEDELQSVSTLKVISEYLVKLENSKKLTENHIPHAPVAIDPVVASIYGEDDYYRLTLDERIEDCKETYEFIVDGIKARLYEYYKRGYIPEEYLNERFKRLDAKNFKVPKMYSTDNLPGMEKYVKTKYPTIFNEFSEEEKKSIYLGYINQCEEERRQFILRNFLVEKGLTNKRDYQSEVYNSYVNSDLNKETIESNKKLQEIEKNADLDFEEIKDGTLPVFDDLSEIGDDSNLEIEDLASMDALNQLNAKKVSEEERFLIKESDPFYKWIGNLKDVIKEELGIDEYEAQNIDDNFEYDPLKHGFNFWLEDHLDALESIFEDDLSDAFSLATRRLDEKSREIFAKEIVKFPEFKELFENEINEFPDTPLYNSNPNEDDIKDIIDNPLKEDFVKKLIKDLDEKQVDDKDDKNKIEDDKNKINDEILKKK